MIPDENPRVPEGINVSQTSPVKDLILLVVGVGVAFLVVVFMLWHVLTFSVRFIPIAWESRIANPVIAQLNLASEQQSELQQRLDRILTVMDYEGPTPIHLSVISSNEINAFATLGGNIFVFTGLLDALDSDVGLDMVLAHEAAHIIHRDPIKSAARAMGINLVMALISGNGDFTQARRLMGIGNQLLFLNTSRDQERAADKAALEALVALYGHVDGAEELFVSFSDNPNLSLPVIFSSHPHPEERIEYIQHYIEETHAQ